MLRLINPFTPDAIQQRRIRLRKPGTALQCQCGCREAVLAVVGAAVVDGKVTGGTKQWLCAECFRRGERKVMA